jgi:hypothetical protein
MWTTSYLRPFILTTLLVLTACGGTPAGTDYANSRSDDVESSQDTDDDGDGVNDIADACPLDPTETLDSDGDGICDNADLTPSSTIDELISGGVVGGFGSIYVNGVRYSTDTAEFVNDDNESLINGEQHLEVGHYVWIEGTINDDGATGVANVVIYDVNLKGAVSIIDPPNRQNQSRYNF